MIKLIASDIDGTLVSDGSDYINPRLFEVIAQLKQKGILFAAASGRQFPSIRNLFAPVQDNVIFIAENGAYIVCRDTEMSITPMNRSIMESIVAQMRTLPHCHLTASGKDVTYIESREEAFVDLLVNGYHNTIQVVDDVTKVESAIIKLALYRKDGIEKEAEQLIKQWQDKVKVVVAGKSWLDFMDFAVDKGHALATIQQITGIRREETICFGDNSNDIGMFHQSGQSYVVSSALPNVQKEADQIIGTYQEDSVLKELEKLL